MRLPRMTKRRWMVAVAIVPILLIAAMVIERRRDSFRQLALFAGRMTRQYTLINWASSFLTRRARTGHGTLYKQLEKPLMSILAAPAYRNLALSWHSASRNSYARTVAMRGFHRHKLNRTRRRVEYAEHLRLKYAGSEPATPGCLSSPIPPCPSLKERSMKVSQVR